MKDVLVTGAAGGMGREAVKLLAGRGYRVFALDRIPSAAEENVCLITADVTDPESVGAAFAAVREQTGRLYAVIHFAGIYLLDSLIEMTPGDFERIFRINLGGAYLVNRTFRPLPPDRRFGRSEEGAAGKDREKAAEDPRIPPPALRLRGQPQSASDHLRRAARAAEILYYQKDTRRGNCRMKKIDRDKLGRLILRRAEEELSIFRTGLIPRTERILFSLTRHTATM